MSVPKWRRDSHEKDNKKGYQDATSAAERLFHHTIKKTGGPGGRAYFSKSDTFTRKIPLLKTSRKVFKFCKHANRIYPTKPHHFKKRRKKIIKALCKVDDMYTYLTAFNEEKPITGLEHWTGLIHDTENLLESWLKSDEERREKMKQKRHILKYQLKQSLKELKKLPFGNRRKTNKTARNQFLRTPNVGNANNVRNVNASTGALNNNNANNSNAESPDCNYSQTE